jgi:carbonic anhydrase
MTSRRQFLGALPVVALAVAACGSKHTAEEVRQSVGPPPNPKTPDEALKVLAEGNARFAARTPQIRETADIELLWSTGIDAKQEPFATILGCSDSRLAPELIFDQFVGDIFVVREAGNVADSPTNLGSLEYSQAVLKSKVLVVLGHSDCGAVNAAYTNAEPGANIQSIINVIKPGIAGATSLEDAVIRNVRAVKDQVGRDSALLREAAQASDFKIVGAYYDIKTATVRFL